MKKLIYITSLALILINTTYWSKVTADTYTLLRLQKELTVGLMCGHEYEFNRTWDYPKWAMPEDIYEIYHTLRQDIGETIKNLDRTRMDPDEHCEDEETSNEKLVTKYRKISAKWKKLYDNEIYTIPPSDGGYDYFIDFEIAKDVYEKYSKLSEGRKQICDMACRELFNSTINQNWKTWKKKGKRI